MALKIQQQELHDLIQKAYPVVPSKSTLQILQNFKVSLRGNEFEIAATDLDHSIIVKANVEPADEFSIAVNARKITEIVRELPRGSIEITVDDNVFIINSEKGFSCKIAGADTADFPDPPQVESMCALDIEATLLCELIQKSSFAVSRDESRAVLCGVLFEIDAERIGMVATDGHRLGSSFVPGAYQVERLFSPIIAPRSLQHVYRLVNSNEQSAAVTLDIGEKYIMFSQGNIVLCSKLIDGPYPDYQKVIPAENPKQAIMERDIVIDAVRRVSVLSNQKTNLVKFNFSSNEAELIVLNRDIGGEARERIAVGYEHENHSIGFNAHYLSEIMGIIQSPKVRLEMNTQISACLLFPHFDDEKDKKSDDLFLIMPLRIVEEI
ncbi:MAG: DNA polymerase III subunit beta [Chitinivibrionales bacterium]|nr:DNA polymerase III subunit beta [Chitinivibrionales bacterium]